MQFSQLVHLPPALVQLRQMAAEDRMPHASLLQAPAGGGGLPAALALATYLLCEDRQAEDSCGVCRACRKSSKWVHPDLHFAFPTVGTNVVSDSLLAEWRQALANQPYQEANDWLQAIGAENKQGNLNKEECAAIIRKLSLKIFEGRYKIMLIWLPEYLGNEGNRLLKMIEEPPPQTIFLLVSERPELILNTILSRCQLSKLGAPDQEAVAQWLADRGTSPDGAAMAARLSGGNVQRALRLGENEDVDHGRRFLTWMRNCHSGSPTKLVEWTNDFAGLGRENQKEFLRYALHFWREFLQLRVCGPDVANLRLGPAEVQTAQKMAQLIDLDQLDQIVGVVNDCIEQVERNAHPKILFMHASLQLHKILRKPRAAKIAVPQRTA
ncbi:MAG: hypothetical protein AAF433_02685 [Bacteroidota bacterium]